MAVDNLPNLADAYARWQLALTAWRRAAPGLFKEYRRSHQLGMRAMEEASGTAASIICHVERKRRKADVPVLLRLERLLQKKREKP